jgi:hypothetical protein
LRSAFPAGLKDPFNFNAEQIREDIKSSSSIAMNTDDRPLLEFLTANNFIKGL